MGWYMSNFLPAFRRAMELTVKTVVRCWYVGIIVTLLFYMKSLFTRECELLWRIWIYLNNYAVVHFTCLILRFILLLWTPERIDRLTRVLNKRQTDLTVVLENVFDPHNISAVMRTCDAVGHQDIYILNIKYLRIGMGSKKFFQRSKMAYSVTSWQMRKECFLNEKHSTGKSIPRI